MDDLFRWYDRQMTEHQISSDSFEDIAAWGVVFLIVSAVGLVMFGFNQYKHRNG